MIGVYMARRVLLHLTMANADMSRAVEEATDNTR